MLLAFSLFVGADIICPLLLHTWIIIWTNYEHFELFTHEQTNRWTDEQLVGTPPRAYTLRLLRSLTSVKTTSFRSLVGLLMWNVRKQSIISVKSKALWADPWKPAGAPRSLDGKLMWFVGKAYQRSPYPLSYGHLHVQRGVTLAVPCWTVQICHSK